ncbi:MAG: transposase [Planctomycetota bacterium]
MIYHVLNRANARVRIFRNAEDFRAFERVLFEALARFAVRLLAYCLMPNHWHLALRPDEERGQDLPAFMHWLTSTHVRRWHKCHGTNGMGHLYQGRYRSFPVQTDQHFLKVCRYVEANSVRARLVECASEWEWSSLWRRLQGPPATDMLTDWPVEMPDGWLEIVNARQCEEELKAIRHCVGKGRPYGEIEWVEQTAHQLGIESTLRPVGHPVITVY